MIKFEWDEQCEQNFQKLKILAMCIDKAEEGTLPLNGPDFANSIVFLKMNKVPYF